MWTDSAEVSSRAERLSVRIRAPGRPAASAEMPRAVRRALAGTWESGVGSFGGLTEVGRIAQGAAMPRSSGSSLSTLAVSRIAETPSIRAWWILW